MDLIKQNTILVWDIENTSLRYIKQVKEILKYIPEKIYIVTKQKLSNHKQKYIKNLQLTNIKIVESNIEADFLIKFILKISSERNTDFTIVSSDSDFVPVIKMLVSKDKKVNLFLLEKSSRAILMKTDVTNKNISHFIMNKLEKTKRQLRTKEYFKRIVKEKKVLTKKQKRKNNIEEKLKEHRERIEEINRKSIERRRLSLEKKSITDIVKPKKIKNLCKIILNENNFEINKIKEKKEKNTVLIQNVKQIKTKEMHYLKEKIRIEHRYSFSDVKGICYCCKKEVYYTNKVNETITPEEDKICLDCERLYILEIEQLKEKYGKEYIKSTTHKEKLDNFSNKLKKEIELNGFIDYGESVKIDLIQRELNKITYPKNLI